MPSPAAAVPRRRVAVRVALWLGSLLVLALAVLALEDRWTAVGGTGGLPGTGPVAAAVAVNVLANALLAFTWGELTAVGGGRRPSWPTTSWVWAASQLARYGLSGAQVAGRAVLARRHGLGATAGGVTALVEVAWQVAVSALLALATLPWWLPGADGVAWVALAGLAPAAVLVVGSLAPDVLLAALVRVVSWGPVSRVTRGRLSVRLGDVRLRRRDAARLTALFACNTGLRLVAFVVLLVAVGGAWPADLPLAVGAFALGQFVGRVAVFAPGGIGPREGVTALVLGPVLGAGPALVLVAATRLVEVVAELVFVAVAWTWRPSAAVTGGRDPSSSPTSDGG